jgi:quinoprotein dehydrogenase-associated probable ABC transporter substrate-binding protein
MRRVGARHRRGAGAAVAIAALVTASVAAASAQAPGLGSSVELVDPNSLRVCADPRNMPYSDAAGEGFENRIARLFADGLKEPVAYVFQPQVIGFYRNTLDALRCDMVMGVAIGEDLVQTTNPYYTTVYALVFKPGTGLDGVDTLEDAQLKGRHLGVIAGTPPATIMVRDGLMAAAKPYPLTVDTRVDAPVKDMVNDIMAGRIDAGVLWGPFAGHYARTTDPHLTVVPLLKEHGVPMAFRIAMGVRRSDQAWKRKLNSLIAQNQAEIDHILADYGVPLVGEAGQVTP